ncbi:MAG TPA: hypothetical protein PKH69_05695 [Thiobacillaceae bacterium]|nr:hypothetical protein [Thiobacillaceae bacterium]HNU64201.1 hypothetical protein [Thiobacillaceae bacterium]
MIDPSLAIAKFEQLVWLAATAESDIDRATLFGAVMALCNALKEEDAARRLGLEKCLQGARWSVCAMLGYDTTHGHDKDTHLVWALGWVAIMRRTLGERQGDTE